jgi:hypothetical protein
MRRVTTMLRKALDILSLSLFSFLKVSFPFLSFIFLSAFLLINLEYNPLNAKRIKPIGTLASPIAVMQENKASNGELEYLTMTGAEIFKFILRLSDEISPSDAHKLAKLIRQECESYGLDPLLILAMIQIESRFDPIAVSHRGAIGLMQVMPETAEFVAEELGVPINGIESLYNPFINVRLGIYYLSLLINRFQSIEEALIAYNLGPNRLAIRSAKEELPSYVRRVLNLKNFLENQRVNIKES